MREVGYVANSDQVYVTTDLWIDVGIIGETTI